MPDRKKRNPSTVLYDLDVSWTRRELGVPNDPKMNIPKIFARIKENPEADFLRQWQTEYPEDFETGRNEEFSLQNPEWVGVLFHLAIQLNERNKATDRAVVTAFKAAGLDIRVPVNWRRLMEIFCWAHFGEKGKPGREIFWTSDRYCELLRDVYKQKEEHALTTDKDACKAILNDKNLSKKYRVSVQRLQKALREARDIRYNADLAILVYEAAVKEKSSLQIEDLSSLSEDEYELELELERKRRATRLRQLARKFADEIGRGSEPNSSKDQHRTGA